MGRKVKSIPKRRQFRVVFEIGTLYGVCFVYAETESEARGKFFAEYAKRGPTITLIKEEI